MSIVKLKKLTLCGLKTEKTATLEKLQILGGTHLIALNKMQVAADNSNPKKLTGQALHVLKYLNQCAKKRHQVNDATDFNLDEVIQQVLALQTELRNLCDQRDFLINRIKEVKPWGNFILPEDEDFAGIKCWFYIVPRRLMTKLDDSLVFQVVHQDNIHSYVVVLAEQEPALNHLPVPRTHTGTVSLQQLQKNLQTLELALQDKQAERESLTRWIALITLSLAKNEDDEALKTAHGLTLDEQNLFALQVWIPEKQLAKLKGFALDNGLACLVEDVSQQDHPPTLLENPLQLAGGEEVVKFYQTPAYHSWDPSVVVFFSFAFFFAMILSDAGYAAVFTVLLIIKWNKLGKSSKGQRLRLLAVVTLIFSMIWGVLTGGYFGFSPNPDSWVGYLKILEISDFDSMMRLSISVGVFHIILANLIKAFQLKGKKTSLAAWGWICLVVAGYQLWLAIDDKPYGAYGLFILGGILLLFFSSERIMTKPSDYLWQILDGIKNITGITKIFGDILSYLRLFALGLASASLALTFNQLAEQVSTSVSGLGLLFSILILIFGHTLNLMLCLMSGVVHGLRLNFIEFYNWSVSDEGYPFKSFSKKGE